MGTVRDVSRASTLPPMECGGQWYYVWYFCTPLPKFFKIKSVYFIIIEIKKYIKKTKEQVNNTDFNTKISKQVLTKDLKRNFRC